MKKRIFLSAVLMVTVCLLMGGATFAVFSSTASSGSSSLAAGTVILEADRDQSDNIPGPMFYSAASDGTGLFPYDTHKNAGYEPPGGEAIGGWAPGDVATRALNVYNRGSLDARITKVQASVNVAGETSGTAYDEFIDKMNIKVMYPASSIQLYNGKLSGLLNGWVTIPTPIRMNANTGSANITFEASLDSAAGNLIQGKSFVFDFSLYGEQIANN